MGGSFYDSSARFTRATDSGFYTKSADNIFTQNKKKMIHESMEPKQALIREARDSNNHPKSVPIVFALDVTGSMGKIPHMLIKDGLPKMMGNIIEHGFPDPQILFLAVGDVESDRYPLQVGQFESGDVELDTWLTRTYVEGGGGGNGGESYNLAWYFAAKHTVTDAWEKRKEKGFIFTVGDEPCLSGLPKNVLNELLPSGVEKAYTNQELLELASERYEIFHLHVMQGSAGRDSVKFWENLLGERCIKISDYETIPDKLSEIVVSVYKNRQYDFNTQKTNTTQQPPSETKDEPVIIL